MKEEDYLSYDGGSVPFYNDAPIIIVPDYPNDNPLPVTPTTIIGQRSNSSSSNSSSNTNRTYEITTPTDVNGVPYVNVNGVPVQVNPLKPVEAILQTPKTLAELLFQSTNAATPIDPFGTGQTETNNNTTLFIILAVAGIGITIWYAKKKA